jgi:hypothetical protein
MNVMLVDVFGIAITLKNKLTVTASAGNETPLICVPEVRQAENRAQALVYL